MDTSHSELDDANAGIALVLIQDDFREFKWVIGIEGAAIVLLLAWMMIRRH